MGALVAEIRSMEAAAAEAAAVATEQESAVQTMAKLLGMCQARLLQLEATFGSLSTHSAGTPPFVPPARPQGSRAAPCLASPKALGLHPQPNAG